MTKLSVNVNKIATVRNARPGHNVPDLEWCARLCLEAGAAGITVHPRPDERHIRAADVPVLAQLVARYPGREYNIEGNPFEGRYMEHCLGVRPTQATLVPDKHGQATSDHGFALDDAAVKKLRPVIEALKGAGCRVSIFMDADPPAMKRAKEVGADRIELYTEPYASAFARGDRALAKKYAEAARAAQELGMGVNAGHDLSLENLRFFLENVPGVLEVSIGQALVADALEYGLAGAVERYMGECER